MSTLTLYRTHLTPSKNALVDELSTYLADRITYGPVDIQYQKPALDLAIKLTIPQAQLTRQDIGNYAALKQDNMTFYYFIMSAAWKSANTVEVTLSIDSINTFNGYIRFSNKTTVIRQHENRFNNIQPYKGSTMAVTMNVDDVDEGLTTTKVRASDTKITDSNAMLNQKWFLVYKSPVNPTAASPVDCLLVPQYNTIKYRNDDTPTEKKMAVTDFSLNTYYYWLKTDNSGGSFTITMDDGTTYTRSLVDNHICYIFNRTDDNKLNIYECLINSGTVKTMTGEIDKTVQGNGYVTFTASTAIRYYPDFTLDLSAATLFAKTNWYANKAGTWYLQSIDSVDRTLSTIVKIIECPYCPVDLNFDTNSVLIMPDGFEISTEGYLKLTNLTREFSKTLDGSFILPLNLNIYEGTLDEFKHTTRNIKYEPKLYNSAFYTYKIVYDSFSAEVQLERVNDEQITKSSIEYKQSNNITSDCGFKIDSTNVFSQHYNWLGDYDMYILSTRNNESPIYTNEYLDYMRTGYNYDKKSQMQTLTNTMISGSVSLVGAVASFAGGVVTGGLSLTAGTSLLATAITTIANGISTTASAERSIQQKIDEAKAQAVQINGADDVNLLNWYSGNKLHIMTYQATDKMRDQLWDLFHYCGYARNIQEKPNFTSRYWFNYVQCNLDDADVDSNSILNNYVDDIKSRWSAGVTIYHCHDGEYDWAQQYENWETAFISA